MYKSAQEFKNVDFVGLTSVIGNTGGWYSLWRSHVLRQNPVFAEWLRWVSIFAGVQN